MKRGEVPVGVRRGPHTGSFGERQRHLCGGETCIGPDSLGSDPVKNSACIPCGQAALALAVIRARCHPGKLRVAKPKINLYLVSNNDAVSPEVIAA